MADSNIGGVTELVNNEKLELTVMSGGSNTPPDDDDNFWIMLQDLNFNLDRPITREITSDASNPAVYFFGGGNNSIDFTILLSTPEFNTNTGSDTIGSLVYLQKRNAYGNLPEKYWRVKATDVSGTSRFLKFKAQLPRLTIQRLTGVGGVVIRGTLTMTDDTVTVATS